MTSRPESSEALRGNFVFSELLRLNLSKVDTVEPYFPCTRDAEDVSVWRCRQSGILFLSQNICEDQEIYRVQEGFSYWDPVRSNAAPPPQDGFILPDDFDRKDRFHSMIRNKKWLDFGCGMGGLLRLMRNDAPDLAGIEIQPGPRRYLHEQGLPCFDTIAEIADESWDIITLFHVFEHLSNPIETLKQISKKLKHGAELIIEVPHARDALLSLYDSEVFKKFTFWSQHLILHTRDSLARFVCDVAGLKLIAIEGLQRYPLSNHLHWLAKSLPGGHQKWAFLNNSLLQDAYSKTLQSIDATDSLICYAIKT